MRKRGNITIWLRLLLVQEEEEEEEEEELKALVVLVGGTINGLVPL